MSEHEDGLEIDAQLIAQSIKENRKSGTGVFYRPLILTLEQAHEDGAYEAPETFKGDFPEYAGQIDTGDAAIQYALKQADLLFHLWREIYKAASESKNQIGLDETMEWGKAFAAQYADLMAAFESQKNFVCYHLPALKQIEELKAELAKGKESANAAEIAARLDKLETCILSMGGKLDLLGISQQENREAESAEHAAMVKEIHQDHKQKAGRPGLTQADAAGIIKRIAMNLEVKAFTTCTVRTIQNWESKAPKHSVPSWYPGRNCELATFAAKVKVGLESEQTKQYFRQTMRNIRKPLLYGNAEQLDYMANRPNYKLPHHTPDDIK